MEKDWSFLKKTVVFYILFLLIGISNNFVYAQNENKALTFGSGGKTGSYYSMAHTVCNLLNSENTTIKNKCDVKSTNGSLYNIDAIRTHQLDLAFIQSNVAYNAYHSEEWFDNKKITDLRLVLKLYPETVNLLTNDVAIKRFEDLANKKFNIGASGSGAQTVLQEYLNMAKLQPSFFKKTFNYSAEEQNEALCNGKIDAFIYVEGHPSNRLINLMNQCNAKLVSITGDVVDQLVSHKLYYSKYVIPANLYKNNNEDIPTLGTDALLIASENVSEDKIYHLVKTIYERFDEFQKASPALAFVKREDLIEKNNIIPLHDGVKRFFKEKGLLE